MWFHRVAATDHRAPCQKHSVHLNHSSPPRQPPSPHQPSLPPLPSACRPQISLSGRRSSPQSPGITLSTSSSTYSSTSFSPSMILTDHHHHYQPSRLLVRFAVFLQNHLATQSRDMDNIHDRRKKINVLYQRVSFQFCA